jgi:sugar phosphate isomerase/epimerase
MKLLVFRALWGMTGPAAEQIERIAAAGYDGIEGAPPEDMPRADFLRRLDEHHLKLILGAQVDRLDQLETTLKRLADYGPLKIDLHSGRDSFSRDEGRAYFEAALRLEDDIRLPVGHETHRGRMFFSPWDTAFYLREFPALKIVADYSHWVTVCERLPDDQADALELANQRAIHIHGRVGYEEGPQVPDPAAPEYAAQLAWHETQWQRNTARRATCTRCRTPISPSRICGRSACGARRARVRSWRKSEGEVMSPVVLRFSSRAASRQVEGNSHVSEKDRVIPLSVSVFSGRVWVTLGDL